jgi:hypothetical protein
MVEGLYPQGNQDVTDAVQVASDTGAATSLYSDAYGVPQETPATTTDVPSAGNGSFQGDPGMIMENNFQSDPGIVAENDFQGDPGIYTDTTTGTDATAGTDATSSTETTGTADNVSAATSDAQQAATNALVRRLLDDPSFMFAMKTAGDNMSQQGFSTFLNFVQEDVAAYPTADDQSILLDAAQKGQAAGMDAADLSVLQGYIGQPTLTTAETADATTTDATIDTTGVTTDTTGGAVPTTTGDTTSEAVTENTTEAMDVIPVG